ncbi:hypothetical protein MBLNU459_g4689t1 [Dothideomycetes sp. NU459]
MLGIIGASGKLGFATLSALLEYKLVPTDRIVACTSSQPHSETWEKLSKTGVHVRHASFEDAASIERALSGCDKLFLVSTPRIEMDYNDAPHGEGREKSHFVAIDAARAAGVAHIYYSSLAFQNPSKAGVMRAHVRTEAYLASLHDVRHTIIREGLYNESWPLYFGYYDPEGDDRTEVTVGGDSPISWTSIADLGLGNALVVTASSSDYAGKSFWLSANQDPKTLTQVAEMVSAAKGKQVSLSIVSRHEHEQYYIKERKMPEDVVKWWSTTYDALRDQECLIDDPTLEQLLSTKGRKPKPLEETVKEMIVV